MYCYKNLDTLEITTSNAIAKIWIDRKDSVAVYIGELTAEKNPIKIIKKG